MRIFTWFRTYVRKIGIFGVEVEFHPPPTEVAPNNPSSQHPPAAKPISAAVIENVPKPNAVNRTEEPVTGEELTFEGAIQAIRKRHPEAVLGRTAEQGQYFERAKWLTNYRLHAAEPPWYGAVQQNGKIMWLYLGKGGKICCGDKE